MPAVGHLSRAHFFSGRVYTERAKGLGKCGNRTALVDEKRKKIRVEFRKNRQKRTRANDLTRGFAVEGESADDALVRDERVRAKGELSRRRTIVASAGGEAAGSERDEPTARRAVDTSECIAGRVVKVHGLESVVETEDGTLRCGVRRVLKTLAIDERHVIAAGDRVWVRRAGADQGVIERVEPRAGTITRGYRRQRQVIAANVDQILVVSSFAEPGLKPPLIDRYLISAEQGGVRPVIVLNKADLVDMAGFQWVLGLYSQLGYEVLVTSASDGRGLARLRAIVSDGCTAVSGQSGVGKSSLLNAIQPGLGLRVTEVSEWTSKGRHTTTTAELIKLETGGYVVDTPGLRQFELWDVDAFEIEGYYPEFRPYIPKCRFPDCSHTHEVECAVKDAVRSDQIHISRYESYLKLYYQKPIGEE
jgi:ribosome biogenesis GTPase